MKQICQANVLFERRMTNAVLAAGLFFGLLTLFLVSPADLPLPACTFHSITGHSCMTCGMTRSIHAISHGDLAASVRYHLLGPAALLAMLLGFVIFAAQAVSGRPFAIFMSRKTRSRVVIAFAVVWLVYWGVRLIVESVA